MNQTIQPEIRLFSFPMRWLMIGKRLAVEKKEPKAEQRGAEHVIVYLSSHSLC